MDTVAPSSNEVCPFAANSNPYPNPWEEENKTLVDWVQDSNFEKVKEALEAGGDPNTLFSGGYVHSFHQLAKPA